MRGVEHRLVGIGPSAGTTLVDGTELEKKLGKGAWSVWQRLAVLRDREGFVHPTVPGIARLKGHARLSEVVVKRGLKRLRDAGLLFDIGWTDWKVYDRGNQRVRKVYLRECRGAELLPDRRRSTTLEVMEQAPKRQCLVPQQTATWLTLSSGWGGKRSGAGRAGKRPKPMAKESSGTELSNSSGTPDSNNPHRGLVSTSSPSEKTRAREPRAKVDSHSEVQDLPDIGSMLGGGGGGRGPGGLPPGCPPYPGPSVVEAARVPSPPRLDEVILIDGHVEPELRERAVRQLLRAYKGACAGRLGEEVHPYRRGKLTSSKHYPRLVECAQALAEHEIPPTSWAGFSCDVWARGGDDAAETVQRLGGDGAVKGYLRGSKGAKGKAAPALTWVMSKHRVEKWRGWFRSEASSYAGGRLVYGPALRDLLARWQRMRTAVRRLIMGEKMATNEAIARLVAEHFPPERGGYEGAVDAAKRESQREQARLERCVLRGDWVW